MSNYKSRHLEEKKKDQKIKSRQLVLDAVGILGNGSSYEIAQYITSQNEKPIGKPIIDKAKILRTVQRRLSELMRDGLVEYKNKKYCLTEEASNIKYFGNRFGNKVLLSMLDDSQEELRTIEQNLQYLIYLFGSYVVFCCMERAKPIQTTFGKSRDSVNSHLQQLESAAVWMNGAINIADLFYHFLHVFRNQIDDDIVKNTKKISLWNQENGKPVYVDVLTGKKYHQFKDLARYLYVDSKGNKQRIGPYERLPINSEDPYVQYLDKYDRFHGIDAEPPYEQISIKIYENLVKAFRELQPEFSKKLRNVEKAIFE